MMEKSLSHANFPTKLEDVKQEIRPDSSTPQWPRNWYPLPSAAPRVPCVFSAPNGAHSAFPGRHGATTLWL